MSAVRNVPFKPMMNLSERKTGTMTPRPTTGDHSKIVSSAMFEACVKNAETLLALSKV